MMKLYDNYLGYPTVIKLAFCDRRGKQAKCKKYCGRGSVCTPAAPEQLSTVPGIEELSQELTDNVAKINKLRN
jgi:hypothetical protein